MGHNKDGSLPLTYDDSLDDRPVLPFMFASYGRFQDTVIIGPRSIPPPALHDFKEALYGPKGDLLLSAVSVKIFQLRSRTGVALVFNTSVPDDTGRTGQKMVLGILANAVFAQAHSAAMVEYLDLYCRVLNRKFGVSLPSSGADSVLARIQAAEEDGTTMQSLQEVLGSLLAASAVMGEVLEARRFERLRSKLGYLFRRRTPKAIIYDSKFQDRDTLAMLLREVTAGMLSSASSSLSRQTDDTVVTIQKLALVRSSVLDGSYHSVELRRVRGKTYICLY